MIHRPKVVQCCLATLFIALLVPTVPSAYAIEAFQESAGQVVIEAENHDAKIPRSNHDWTASTAKSGYSGTSAMRATPETTTEITTGYATTSPELVYNIDISTPGTYYVWMRGFKPDGGADSVHVGIDGTAPSSGSNMDQFIYNQWTWVHDTRTVQIPTTGLHTFHIWMREDGFYADKIVLRQGSAGTAPSGTGPAESPRVPVGGDTTPPAGSITINGGTAATNNTSVTLTLSATDNSGTVTQMQFSNDGGAFSALEPYSSAPRSWTIGTGEGDRMVTVKYWDAAGNFAPFSDSITLDTTSPVLSAISTSNVTQTAATVTWTTDEGADSVVEYGLTTSYGQTASDSALVTNHSVGLTGLSAVTTYHYRVKSKDAANNLATSADATFQTGGSDVTPPTNTSILINGGAVATGSATVTLTLAATDPSGVAQMQFSNDNGQNYSPAEPYNTTRPSWTLPAGNGSKTVLARFSDTVGNWSTPVSDSIILDTSVPSITITSPRDGEVLVP